MFTANEKVSSESISIRAKLIAVAAAATMLAGCSSSTTKEVSPKPSTTIAPSTTTAAPKPSETKPFDVMAYQSDPQRVSRITSALQGFGLAVLTESKKSNSVWGPFDTYCFSDVNKGIRTENDTKWISKGYTPKAGDRCFIQHNPQYGGKNMQVSAELSVLDNGTFGQEIKGVNINVDGCTLLVDYDDDNKVPIVGFGDGTHFQTVGRVTTLAEAETIDTQTINCLNEVRP